MTYIRVTLVSQGENISDRARFSIQNFSKLLPQTPPRGIDVEKSFCDFQKGFDKTCTQKEEFFDNSSDGFRRHRQNLASEKVFIFFNFVCSQLPSESLLDSETSPGDRAFDGQQIPQHKV